MRGGVAEVPHSGSAAVPGPESKDGQPSPAPEARRLGHCSLGFSG